MGRAAYISHYGLYRANSAGRDGLAVRHDMVGTSVSLLYHVPCTTVRAHGSRRRSRSPRLARLGVNTENTLAYSTSYHRGDGMDYRAPAGCSCT
eukprot:6067720-Prymnesium_polylepis.1